MHGATRVFARRIERARHTHQSVATVELDVAGARQALVIDRERVVVAHGEDALASLGVEASRLHDARLGTLGRTLDLDENATADPSQHDLLASDERDGAFRRLDPAMVRDVSAKQRDVRGLDVARVHDIAREIEAVDAGEEVLVRDRAGGGHQPTDFDDGFAIEEDAGRVQDVHDAVREEAALDPGRAARHAVQHPRIRAGLEEADDLSGEDVEALVVDDRAIARADQRHAAIAIDLDIARDDVLARRCRGSRHAEPECEGADQRAKDMRAGGTDEVEHEVILSTSR